MKLIIKQSQTMRYVLAPLLQKASRSGPERIKIGYFERKLYLNVELKLLTLHITMPIAALF